MKVVRVAAQILIALLVLSGAGIAAWILLKTAPQTEPEDKKQASKIVQVIHLTPSDERIVVEAWGTVMPARDVTMQAQVEGRVIVQNEALVPGGRFAEGEELVSIDPADYEMALTEREAELAEAKYEFDVESGRQIIAQREWEQLRKDLPTADINPSLALREPHLRRAEAMVAKAESAIERARLDLDRTRVTAPFNCMVVDESVEVGQLLNRGNDICRLVGTDAFWVRATLPMADLKRIRLPEGDRSGSAADIHLDTGNGQIEPWGGSVVRLLADLEESGRMARILVKIEDPLALANSGGGKGDGNGRTPLLLCSYVRVDVEAGRLEGVLEIPRPALREGNRIWLVGPDKRIRIAEPEILWTRRESVLIPNILNEGERLIVSELKAALPGMLVNPQPLVRRAPEESAAKPK